MSSWTQQRARVAALSRSRSEDDPELIEAKRQLKASRLTEYVSDVLAAAPPLTPEQRGRIADLLRPPSDDGAQPLPYPAHDALGGDAA